MWRASSASATCRASRSASEYTATVRTPRSRAAVITRQAISPRLATRILRNTLVLFHPGGLALLDEGSDPLAALGRNADLGDALRCVVDQGIVDRPGDRADEVLDLPHRKRSAQNQVVENFPDLRVEVARRHEHGEHAQPVRFGRVEAFAGKEISLRRALADGADDVGADRRRRQADLDLGQGEEGLR